MKVLTDQEPKEVINMTGKGTEKAKKAAEKLANDKSTPKERSKAGKDLNKHKIESHKGKGK